MRYNASHNKKVVFIVIFFLLVFVFGFKIQTANAYSDDELSQELETNTDKILDDIDTSALDEYLENDSGIGVFSFKDFAVRVLSGSIDLNYESLFSELKEEISLKFKENLRFFVYFFICIVIFEVFKTFCLNKYIDLKTSVKIIFSSVFCVLVLSLFKTYYKTVSEFIDSVFKFSAILFPILISLITLSGSVTSSTMYSSFSVFLLNTGSYIIRFVLLPLAVSIFLLSVFSSFFKNKSFDKVIDLFKLVFKYTIILFFTLLGLISVVNVITGGVKDGVNLKLTKFAIKNYVPVLGGYVSEGFDFLHSCSILVKNAFGVCSIFILFSLLTGPIVLSIVFIFGFKFLSVVSSFVGDGSFSDMFENISKSFSNFLSVIIGAFLIMFVFIFLLIATVWVI